jgi:hypothetical protein
VRWRNTGNGSEPGRPADRDSSDRCPGAKTCEESDIDILIEFKEGGRSFDTYMDLKFSSKISSGGVFDLVDRDAIKPALAPHILQSGSVLSRKYNLYLRYP